MGRKALRCVMLAGSTLLAAMSGCARSGPGLAGLWQLSWQGRIGTERATVLLQSHGELLGGRFTTAAASLPLAGAVHADGLSFVVEFPGPPPYRIRFSGVAQGDRIEGQAQAQDGNGRAFAGHGGEVSPDYYRWSATRASP